MPLITKLQLTAFAEASKAFDLTESARVTLNKTYQAVLSSGVLAGQADLTFHDQRTLAPSANEDLDLIGTMLQEPFGSNLSMLRVKGLIVAALGTSSTPNTNNVIVGAAAGSPWNTLLNSTGTVTLRPGTVLAVFAGQTDATGYAVTTTTADLLRVANSAGSTSVTYDIILIGASA